MGEWFGDYMGDWFGADGASPPVGPPITGEGRRFVHELALSFAQSFARDPEDTGA